MQAIQAGEPYPMVGLYFSISFGNPSDTSDSRFKEVSGISMSLEVESISAGGDSGYEISLPKKTTFTDLILKRGLLSSSSPLADWCYSWLLNDYMQKLTKKDVYLKLLDSNGDPVFVWQFLNAFPVKLEIDNFNAMASGDGAILIESITLRYSNIKILKF